MALVLIIDDDPSISYTLSRAAQRQGHTVTFARTLHEGKQKSAEQEFAVVFLDVRLPDGNGLTLLPRLKAQTPSPEVIIITGAGEPEDAAKAIADGAWEYIQKSDSIHQITVTLERALRYREKRLSSPQETALPLQRENIVGDSPALRRALATVEQYAASDVNVLITGETGVGKEMFARAIHENSNRRHHPFIVVDCAALPDTLAEGILYGYTKGAFTGAARESTGLVMQADGGTLFLDEVGELSLEVQKKFLRILQEHTVRPIGSTKELHSNFRMIAATNRNLETMAEEGTFRSDLLFRIKALHLPLPSLMERKEDIRLLVNKFIDTLCRQYRIPPKKVDPELLEVLESYNWPGNVRELRHAIDHAVSAARNEPLLFSQHIPQTIRISVAKQRVSQTPVRLAPLPERKEDLPPLSEYRAEGYRRLEEQYLKDLMLLTEGNIKDACAISELSRSRLYALLKEHGVLQSKTPEST
ncbi:sigma-54-dependent transcriptional regulator [Halodesulfovibrio marinisediminis]|uniref:Two-component system, NtrC family, response regulator n=1 Tax=Halodesulfovibrio marinisediminis DSM 17456 TaxID=1121457 RepID=A0A1N6GTB3_9BACT|nr:sigma-54 dependent transcriptional regulator [Halodesulfovibrio marinisediminis]SIO10585.1 two-component system, NtrC family, response regulator [Halodesulfovibrio marinisediminis DSM 17456]